MPPDAMAAPDAESSPDAEPPPDAAPPDAYVAMSLFEIIPTAASRQVDTDLTVRGFNIAEGVELTIENCDTSTVYDLTSTVVVATDGTSIAAHLAADITREQGVYTVTATNPDGKTDSLVCAFRVLAASPPTVTEVVPSTAYRGMIGDGINSDTQVTIRGTGFQSTPNVRWIKNDASVSYDALFVGYVSDTEITAVVPSETLKMVAGEYSVMVVNPDLLSATWLVDDGGGPVPGVFTITETPPPDIVDVSPSRIENGSCTSTIMTFTGTGFDAAATVWYVAPAGDTCAGSMVDPNGATLCPLVIDGIAPEGTSLTAHFTPCPNLQAYPVVVLNPDGQLDYYFSVEITPSSDGHLNTGDFEIMGNELEIARWRHAATYGFDSFGAAHFYVLGGQDDAGGVLGSVEISQLNVFGTPGPFAIAQQYGGVATPRIANDLLVPRQGGTVVRVGRELFSIGGAAAATDVLATVAGSSTVERARILSFEEMPAIERPTKVGGAGLPVGSWYYQVSAVGPWGEGLATREVALINDGGEVEVCWTAPQAPGATSYNVYRSLASDGRAGTATALAFEVDGPCFTDDGAAELTPAPGNLRGTLATGTMLAPGTYTYRVSATVMIDSEPFESHAGYAIALDVIDTDVTAGNAAVALTWDEIQDATYSVYKWDDGAGGYRLLEGAAGLTTTTFTDDGAALDASDRAPRQMIRPLAPGSLSLWDDVGVPDLNVAREGADGVAIHMDPATSGGLIARILVAGGRTDNSGADGTYLGTAESLAVYEDGTYDMAWYDEAPVFTHARAYLALLTTQARNETVFPPPPEEPPCGDLDGDGYVSCDCAPPDAPAGSLDCNDADASIHPGATEVCGDGIDQDCDMGCSGVDEPCSCTDDVDDDSHVAIDCGGDDCCDDGTESSLGCDATTADQINPTIIEICNDGIDQDCDGVDPPCDCADDMDGDGHISVSCGGDDCCDIGADTSLGCTDATAPGIHPGATDVCSNGIDEDCDGSEPICASYPAAPTAPRNERLLAEPPTGASIVRQPTRDPAPWRRPTPIFDVTGGEPVYIVAVFGDDVYAAASNQGRDDFEVCDVDLVTGHLACDPTWVVQSRASTKNTFGSDALLYFHYMYPFYGVNREWVDSTPSTRTFINSVIDRYLVADDLGAVTADQILLGTQSASTTFLVNRSYYQMTRLMSYVYAIGGWAEAYTDADAVFHPEGPTGTVERHQQ